MPGHCTTLHYCMAVLYGTVGVIYRSGGTRTMCRIMRIGGIQRRMARLRVYAHHACASEDGMHGFHFLPLFSVPRASWCVHTPIIPTLPRASWFVHTNHTTPASGVVVCAHQLHDGESIFDGPPPSSTCNRYTLEGIAH